MELQGDHFTSVEAQLETQGCKRRATIFFLSGVISGRTGPCLSSPAKATNTDRTQLGLGGQVTGLCREAGTPVVVFLTTEPCSQTGRPPPALAPRLSGGADPCAKGIFQNRAQTALSLSR